MNALTLANVTKQFSGKKILQGVDLAVPAGSIYGFVGENGAGKTTTLKILLGLLAADSGSVNLFQNPVTFGQVLPEKVGYLPDVPSFYPYMRAGEYLHYAGKIAGLSREQIKTRSEAVLAQVGLTGVNKRIGNYSRGMKQRLGLAQALLNEPELLICDEPTSALDPLGRKAFLEIFQSLKGQTTILFSTHLLTDVEAICDDVAILHQGKIALAGSLSELKNTHGHYVYELHFPKDQDTQRLMELLQKADWAVIEERQVLHVTVADYQKDGQRLLQLITEAKLVPERFELVKPSLEEVFLKVVQGQ